MTILESFPIHRCIYRNDPQALRELLKDNEIKKRIDECDNHGNTPLNLSLMLDRRNCTIILLNNKCDLLGRNSYGWNSSDEAIMTGDIDIIEKVTLLRWKEYVNIFSCSGGVLEEFTNEVPNLYMKYKLRLKSAIPIIKRLGARDVEEIYKKGSSIRFNTTVAGVDSRGIPKLIKGSISIIGKIDERSGIYKIYLLDNKKKLYQEFFPNIPQWYINNSLKSKIGVSTLYKFYFDFSDVEIKQKKNSILKKAKKTFTLQNNKTYKIELFKCKNFKIIIRKRKDEAMIGDCKSNIKTNISNVDHINSIFKKLEVLDKADDNKSESDKMVNNTNIDNDDNDESDDESDDGSIYSEDTESFIKSTSVESESVFKKYINENDPKSSLEDPVTVTKIDSILERGFDENGVKVTINDLKYLEKYAPIIIKSYFENRNNGKKTYHSFKSENINYTVSKDGRTKIYEIIDEDTNTLDWEAAYNKRYPQNSDILYEVFSGSHKEAFENDDDIKSSKLINYNKEDIISEEEYFDPSSKENLHMGRVMRIDEEVKNNHSSYKFWLSKENEFPVSISQFKSIIDFFSSIFLDQIYMDGPDKKSSIYNNFSNIFYKNFESDRRFLLKMNIPVYPSILIQYKLLDLSTDLGKIPDEIFEIPSDYQYGDVYFNNIK